MKFLLERRPHGLHLCIGLKIGIGLRILEAHVLYRLEKVKEKKRIDTLVLPLWLHADKQKVQSIRFDQLPALWPLPQSESQHLSPALL